ncbi:hypothetical protein D3C76_887020 [compost metagenome]
MLKLALSAPQKIKDLHEKGALSLKLTGGLEELLTNYVQLDFEKSFQDSYIFYLMIQIDRSLGLPKEEINIAKQNLKGASGKSLKAAVKALSQELKGARLESLIEAFPIAVTD